MTTGWAKKHATLLLLHLRQLLTDFQNSFPGTLQTICDNVIIIDPTTP